MQTAARFRLCKKKGVWYNVSKHSLTERDAMATAEKIPGKVRGEVRRDQIVQAALRIIGKKGVSSLTTAAIAKEVGVSEANLYRHFRNKDDIYFATVSQVREMIMGNLEKAVAGSPGLLPFSSHFSDYR